MRDYRFNQLAGYWKRMLTLSNIHCYISTKNDHLKLDGYEGRAWTVAQLRVFDIYSFRTIFAVSVWRALRSTRAFKCLHLGIRRNGVASSAYWRTPLML